MKRLLAWWEDMVFGLPLFPRILLHCTICLSIAFVTVAALVMLMTRIGYP